MRIAKPFFRKQTQSYYCKLNGRFVNLGKDKKAAEAQYHELMIGKQEAAPDITVGQLFDQFLHFCRLNREQRTFKSHQEHLQSFLDHIGASFRVADVKPFHVTRWLASINGGDTHKYNCVHSLKRAFQWAEDEGHINKSNIASVKPPTPKPRETYITPEQWEQFISLVKPGPFHAAVSFLRLTGCRPQELYVIEARHWETNCIVLDIKQSKGRREKRVIPLTKAALAIVERLAIEHPTGFLFQTVRGKQWTSDGLNTCFDKIETKMNVGITDPKKRVKVFPYTIRHSFITDALENGMSPVTLATICGQKSIAMIMRVYSHLKLKHDHLREAMQTNEDTAGQKQQSA